MKQYKERIDKLIKEMTLEEKIGQLNQAGVSLVGAFDVSFEELLNMLFDGRISEQEFNNYMSTAKEDFREDDIRAGRISSFNGVNGAVKNNYIQKIAVEESRLGIPLLIGADIIHGCRTVFPIPLAESCAWDERLWEETAEIAADEATSLGIHWTFAPMLDIARDARWGRISEGAGEDSFLASRFARAKVKGFQGDDVSASNRLLACAKHFAAYGAAESGRDYNTTDMSPQKLREVYLPPFKAAVDAGLCTVMPAFNDINGVPCSVNRALLKDILRDEWGFSGMLISDANAIAECVAHGIAENRSDAALQAISSGLDMDMGSGCYTEELAKLVGCGALSGGIIDEAVRNVLEVKFKKGLFDNPYITSEEREKNTLLKPEFRKKAREAARHSQVLLKNDGVLPLSKAAKIGVAGNLADNREQMLGAWSMYGRGEDCVSILSGIKAATENAVYYPCIHDGEVSEDDVERLARESEIIVAVVGETKEMSGEASSRGDISLPKEQEKLLEKLYDTGKPVVVVLLSGRPLAIPFAAEKLQAILAAWHLGIEAGNAVADVLFGGFNPCGKLTATFPYATGQCPIYYNHTSTGRPSGKSKFTSKYLDMPTEPLYPFGYGLSYSSYQYSELAAGFDGGNLNVSVTVQNTGDMDGYEIVQVYVGDAVARRVRPVKELKAFQKLFLKAGERREIKLQIPVNELGYYDNDMQYCVDKGKFIVYAGGNSRDCLVCETGLL